MNSHKFENGEVTINKEIADLLRYRILHLARERNIGVEPIQYEKLLSDISSSMIRQSHDFEFTYEGKNVDFSNVNPVMFKSKVLKTFLNSNREKESVTIQKKNLDILSFYAFECSWADFKNTLVPSTLNNKDVQAKHKSNYRNQGVAILIVVVIALLGFAVKQYLNIKELENILIIYQSNYNSVCENLYNPVYFKDSAFDDVARYDESSYTRFTSQPNTSLLFKVYFNETGNILENNDSYMYDNAILTAVYDKNLFKELPGVKNCEALGGLSWGFGRTFCPSSCYKPNNTYYYQDTNISILRITLKNKTLISHISFEWFEKGPNWGSTGHVYLDWNKDFLGVPIYNEIGLYPISNMEEQEKKINYQCVVNQYCQTIDICISDISMISEIFINKIRVWGGGNLEES